MSRSNGEHRGVGEERRKLFEIKESGFLPKAATSILRIIKLDTLQIFFKLAHGINEN